MGNRPAIVVSNDKCNASSPVVEIVYLTAKLRKNPLPTHVVINTKKQSIALCEQIHSVSKSRLGHYLGRITEQEELQINYALEISLDLDGKKIKHIGGVNNGEADNSTGGDGENKTNAYLWEDNGEHNNRNRRKHTNDSKDCEKA